MRFVELHIQLWPPFMVQILLCHQRPREQLALVDTGWLWLALVGSGWLRLALSDWLQLALVVSGWPDHFIFYFFFNFSMLEFSRQMQIVLVDYGIKKYLYSAGMIAYTTALIFYSNELQYIICNCLQQNRDGGVVPKIIRNLS